MKNCQQKNKIVFCYGAGHAGEYFAKYLSDRGVIITGFIDQKKKGTFQAIQIYTLEEVKEKFDLSNIEIVISAPSLVDEIKEILLKHVSENQIHAFEVELYQYYGTNYEGYKQYILNNIDGLYDIYVTLKDEKSKEVMLKVIEGRLSADLTVIADIYEYDQYWPKDIIGFGIDEILVECGFSNGETLVELCEKLDNQYSHIYCLEPDKMCENILREKMKLLSPNGKITLITKGTYKENTTLYFKNDVVESGLAKLDENGTTQIEVVTIDSQISDGVIYIKMDIEGAELDTLMGAKRIITENRPKLAVCIYHRDSDIINILSYLQGLVPDYKFYIRHHNCNMTETVLYVI